jgi:DnaJ-class molecular chaperone
MKSCPSADRGAATSSEKFRLVNEAYETLIDPRSRHSYDLSLPTAQRQVRVRVEPMVARSGSFLQEDAKRRNWRDFSSTACFPWAADKRKHANNA